MNPLYNMIMSGMMGSGNAVSPQSMNPVQKMQAVMQAMQNPFGYLKQKFPDIPDSMQNNPSQIFQYLQQTRNITSNDLTQTMQQIPMQNMPKY